MDWTTKFGGDEPEGSVSGGTAGGGAGRKRRQVVSMIQLDGVPLPYESCLEVPGVELIPEEDTEVSEGKKEDQRNDEEDLSPAEVPKSPDSVDEIRGLINPVVEMVLPVSQENQSEMTNGMKPTTGTITMEDGVQEQVTHVTTVVEDVTRKSPQDKTSPQIILQQLAGSNKLEADKEHQEEAAIKNAIKEIEIAVQEDDSQRIAEVTKSDSESSSPGPPASDSSSHLKDKIIHPVDVEVILA